MLFIDHKPLISWSWLHLYKNSPFFHRISAQVCFPAIHIEEAPTVAYVYQLGEPVESYKVSPFPGNYSTDYPSHMAFYLLIFLSYVNNANNTYQAPHRAIATGYKSILYVFLWSNT